MERLPALTLRRVAATRRPRVRIQRRAVVTPHRAAVTPHLPIPRQAAVTPHRPTPRRAVATAEAGAGITAVAVVSLAAEAEAVPEAVVDNRTEAALTDAKYSQLQPGPNFGAGLFYAYVFAIPKSQLFGGTGVY